MSDSALDVLESFEAHDGNGAVTPKNNPPGWPHFTPSGLPVEKSLEQQDGDDKAIEAKARDIVLPNDLKSAITLWQQAYHLPARTRAERIFKRARKKFVGAHAFKLQQPAAAPNITADHHGALELAKLSRAEKREMRLAALKSAVETPVEDTEQFYSAPSQADAIRQRLIDDEFIFDHQQNHQQNEPIANADAPGMEEIMEEIDNHTRELLTVAVRRLREYEISHLEHYNFIWPDSRKVEVANKIRSGISTEEMIAIKSELIQLNSPQAHSFKSAAWGNLLTAWQPCREALVKLFTHAKEKINAMKEGAIFSEIVFFADHGLLRETTSASRRFDVLLSELEHHLARANMNFANFGTLPDASNQLTWFNIQDII